MGPKEELNLRDFLDILLSEVNDGNILNQLESSTKTFRLLLNRLSLHSEIEVQLQIIESTLRRKSISDDNITNTLNLIKTGFANYSYINSDNATHAKITSDAFDSLDELRQKVNDAKGNNSLNLSQAGDVTKVNL